jgi:hypothetical protein
VVGQAVGLSGPTYNRAKAVVKAGEKDPEKFGDLVEKMDTTDPVCGPHKELRHPRGVSGRRVPIPCDNRAHYRPPGARAPR